MNTETENKNQKKNYDKLVKVLQIAAGVFMLMMVIAFIVLMKKFDISVSNVSAITDKLTGGVLTVAALIILFNLIKSFALIVTPSIIFVISGIVFDSVWVAILVNIIAVAIALIPAYYLGRFTGKGMVDTLRRRFPKVNKIDDFADRNGFIVSFILKASGVIPGDLSSLILGAMDINFRDYYIGASLGTLPINIMWAVLGNKGDLSNPYTFLFILPIIAFALIMSFVMKKITDKKNKDSK